jgi:hypothetical protein
MRGLRPVAGDAQLAVLPILADRRRSLGEDHTQMISLAAPAAGRPDPGRREQGPVRGPGQDAAGQGPPARWGRQSPPAGRRRADQRPGADLPAQQSRGQRTDRTAGSHRNHPDGPARDRPLRRRPAAGGSRRGDQIPHQSPLRVLERNRADRRLLRRPGPPPPVPGRQPPDQPRAAHHGRRPAPQPHRRPRLLPPAGRRRQDTHGGDALPQTPAARHRLPPDDPRRPGQGNGPGRTLGGGYWLQRGRLSPQHQHLGEVTSRTRHQRPYARTRQLSDPFPPPSPPLPASAGPQPPSSTLC